MKIRSERIWTPEGMINGVIAFEDGIITEVLEGETEADQDYGNRLVIPGMIDVHCHGAYGFDTNYADPEGLRMWTKKIVKDGVTGILPTTITDRPETLKKALRNVADVVKEGYEGARILGVHFEGPYLDTDHKGAQPPECIVRPDVKEFDDYCRESNGLICIVTMAPEHDENHELIRYCKEHGIAASIGHTGASFEECTSALEDGARSFTHTFNGMQGMSHRAAGSAGAALYHHDAYSEIICDCYHVKPEVLNIFFACKDADKAVMISDSLMCKGLPIGTHFMFGGHACEVYEDGSAHLVENGTIAGSCMRSNIGLRNLIERAHVPYEKAIPACTSNPADLIGMGDHLGRIRVGYDADLVVLEDDFEVAEVWLKGTRV